jgi:uncharacterized protein
VRRILAIDGGGIKGIFPASFLATIERSAGVSIVEYFDLVVGTSTGGIIALGLGLGYSPAEIVSFYEQFGVSIFPRSRLRTLLRVFRPKYDVEPLRAALLAQFGERRLGESRVRLVVPALNLETGEVHLYKTAHHPRFIMDYRERVVDVALATAAAPTYFREHLGSFGPSLIDGGIWANNPMGVAVTEALGVLQWRRDDIELLSIGCTTSPLAAMKDGSKPRGGLHYLTGIVDLFLAAQSSASEGTAATLIGHNHIQRYTAVVDRRRFDLDDVAGLPALRGLGESEARKAMPRIAATYLTQPADVFVPFHSL